ncbi:hypothetical protein Sste5346_009930 [Sporothrix stenoceras]|uniref:Uncharacterized protein n=1 Tax=Sporothrix stenoceras TaxID=5173 RepID=A0ABR3YJ38_9PEZI
MPGSKAPSNTSGHGRLSIRGIHFQHMDAADATRDAHIAASKAFVHNQEKSGPEAPQTLFPDPYINTVPRITQYGETESNVRPSASRSSGQPQSGSVRFVQNGGQTISSARLEATRANAPWTPLAYQTPVRNAASFDVHASARRAAISESNYSQYTTSLPSTPMLKGNINKTWSSSQVRNKENYGDAAASTAMTRNTIHGQYA